jgi:preprotein translocase subunit SecE
MNKEATIAQEKHDVTRFHLIKIIVSDGKKVTWPQRRQHADSGGS